MLPYVSLSSVMFHITSAIQRCSWWYSSWPKLCMQSQWVHTGILCQINPLLLSQHEDITRNKKELAKRHLLHSWFSMSWKLSGLEFRILQFAYNHWDNCSHRSNFISPCFFGPVSQFFGNIQTQSEAFSSLVVTDYSEHYQGKSTLVAPLLFVLSHWTEMQLVVFCGLLNVGEIEARNAKIHISFSFPVPFSNFFLPMDKSCFPYSKAFWNPSW